MTIILLIQSYIPVKGIMPMKKKFDEFLEIEIKNLGDLIKQVTPDSIDPKSGRFRDLSIFRGLPNASWELFTKLDRLGDNESPYFQKSHLESHIFRNFIRYSKPYITRLIENRWEYLIIAQHHLLPTRLLDWTFSPLAAAHFATIDRDTDADCVIWKLDWPIMHKHFSLEDNSYTCDEIDKLIKDRGFESILDLFDEEDTIKNRFVCMLEPPSIDNRIVAQSAVFTVSSNKKSSLNQILVDSDIPNALTRYIIPNEKIDMIRDQLDMCSIDERRLFPDLDGVAAEMSRYYSTSPK